MAGLAPEIARAAIGPAEESLAGSVDPCLSEVDSTNVFDGYFTVRSDPGPSLIGGLASSLPPLVSGFDLAVGRLLVLNPRAIGKEQGNHALSVIGAPTAAGPEKIPPVVPSLFSS